MKKKYLYTIAVLLVAAMCSCEKNFLDTKVDTSTTLDDLNSSYSNLVQFAVAPYNYIRNEFSIIDANIFAPVSDEAEQTAASSNSEYFNAGTWNASTNPDDYYASYYKGIRAANYFINNSGNYRAFLALNRDTITSSNKTVYQQDTLFMGWYRGEAHILRAYYYFELAKRYGGVPLIKDVATETEADTTHRSSFDSVISFIVSECDQYKDSVQTNWKTSAYTDQDGRVSKGVALALKARALLFWASPLYNTNSDITRWQKAASALHDVITFAAGSGGYSLNSSYQTLFQKTNAATSNETIWCIRYAASHSLEAANYPIATTGGASGVTPSQNLVDAYEWKSTASATNPYANRDPRLGYSIVYNGSTWNNRTIDESASGKDPMTATNASKTGYYLKKFLVDNLTLSKSTSTAVHYWILFRYGEVLLEYAEAMNEAYGPDVDNGYGMTARQAINAVRARTDVGMPAVTATSQDDMRTAIKHERRVELAFENYRYWDLRRWKDGDSLNVPLRGVSVTKNTNGTFSYAITTVEDRVFDVTKMYYYPFSQTEITKSNGVLTQNTGW